VVPLEGELVPVGGDGLPLRSGDQARTLLSSTSTRSAGARNFARDGSREMVKVGESRPDVALRARLSGDARVCQVTATTTTSSPRLATRSRPPRRRYRAAAASHTTTLRMHGACSCGNVSVGP